VLVGDLTCSEAWQKVSQTSVNGVYAPVNGDIVSNVFCSKMADTLNRFLNERMMSLQSIIHNV